MRTVSTMLSTAMLTLAIGTSAFAQSAAPAECGHGQRGHGFDPARMTQRLDRNNNGRIEVAELPEGMRERMATADTNRDGVLSPEEMQAGFEAHRAAMRVQMDTDHDGTISPEEHRAFREARQTARFARLDTNSDGVVTEAEVGSERWSRIGRADADRDGRVTRQELQTAHRGHHGPGASRRTHTTQG